MLTTISFLFVGLILGLIIGTIFGYRVAAGENTRLAEKVAQRYTAYTPAPIDFDTDERRRRNARLN